MQSQREYVLRTVEERAVRFIQLWFTDVLGTRSRSASPRGARERPRRGMTFDGSRSTVSAVCRRATCLPSPTEDLSDPAVPDRPGRRCLTCSPRVLRHHQPRRLAIRRLSQARAQADARACRSRGFSFYAAPRSSTSTLHRANRVSLPSRSTRLVLRADGGGPDH